MRGTRVWWIEGPTGPEGPFTTDDLRRRLRDGGLTPASRVWATGSRSWRPANAALARRGQLSRVATWVSTTVLVISLTATVALSWLGLDRDLPDATAALFVSGAGAITLTAGAAVLLFTVARARRRHATESQAAGAIAAGLLAIAGIGVGAFVLSIAAPWIDATRANDELTYKIEVSPAANQVRVNGYIGEGFGAGLKKALAQVGGSPRIELDSPGGLTAEALEAAKAIEARGVDIHVSRLCASACLVLLSAGAHRSADLDVMLAVHATSSSVEGESRLVDWLTRNVGNESDDFLEAHRYPRELLQHAESLGPTKMIALSPLEALDIGALTEVRGPEGPMKRELVARRFKDEPRRRIVSAITD